MMAVKNGKELKTINFDRVTVINEQIEILVPVEASGNEMEKLIDTLIEDFQMKHPKMENPFFTVNVVYSFDGFRVFVDDESDFKLKVIIWDESNDNITEVYEDIKVNLSEDATMEVKKAIWECLGHMFFEM